MSVIRVGQEIRVDTATADDQFNPQITALLNGDTGDFNADRKADLLWQNLDGTKHWVLVAVCLYAAAAIVAILLAARGNDDAIGYLASLLVFGSFLSPSMAPLRVLAILSNVAFIAYALKCWLPPVMCLHAALLPVNVFRLIQLMQTRRLLRIPETLGRAQRSSSAMRPNTNGDL